MCTVLISRSSFGHRALGIVNTETGKLLEITAIGHCGCGSINMLKRHYQTDGKQIHKQIIKD